MTASDATATYHTLGNEVWESLYWISSCDYRIGKERKERKTEEGKERKRKLRGIVRFGKSYDLGRVLKKIVNFFKTRRGGGKGGWTPSSPSPISP